MPKLRDYFFSDLSTFFNTNEFSESVLINNQEKNISIDEERLKVRGEKEYGGVTTGMILYFIPVAAFPEKPKVGETQIFNGRLMYIDDVKEDLGLYEIIITQNRGE